VVLHANAVHMHSYLLDREFAIRCIDEQQFAAGKFLRRAALVHMHVRTVNANDRLMRPGDRLQAQHIRARAAKHKVDGYVFPEVLLKQLRSAGGDGIISVRDHVTVVGSFDGFNNFRMHTGVIVTGEASFGHQFVFCTLFLFMNEGRYKALSTKYKQSISTGLKVSYNFTRRICTRQSG
jgi:hypothetical protein